MNFQRIIFFEKLPDEIFEFEIPEGATLIEE
jgi:outer membrane lipoprotein-sorting protein